MPWTTSLPQNFPGLTAGSRSSGLGYNPQVPLPTETLPGTLTGLQPSLGNLYGLAGQTNQFNVGQAPASLRANLPGYQSMINQSSENIGSMLKGQVPQDVVSEIIQGAAERGIMTGSPGSPNANSALLRSLGLTSLGLQQQGEQELSGAIARTPQAPLFNPQTWYPTPPAQQEAAAANALYAAAPNPTAVARANLGAAQAGLGAGRQSIGAPTGMQLPTINAAPTPWSPATPDYNAPGSPGAFNAWNQWWTGTPGEGTPQTTTGTEAYLGGLSPEQDTSLGDPFGQMLGQPDVYGLSQQDESNIGDVLGQFSGEEEAP